jgi:hypothetical protein
MYIHSHSLRSHSPRALARATSRMPAKAPSLRQALLLLLALLLAFGVSTLAAEPTAAPVPAAEPTAAPVPAAEPTAAPVIDGRLDDATPVPALQRA